MTPYQLNLCILDHNRRKKAEDEEKIILTYLGAYWQRVKRLPSLKSIMGTKAPKKRMTPEEMLAEIKRINKELGGEVVK